MAERFKSAGVAAGHAAAFLANTANCLLVAEAAGELAGFVVAYRLDRLDRSAAQLFVYEIDVAPEFRRRGVGTRLMQQIGQLVEDEGLMEAFVVTDRGNVPAHRLYSRTGATLEGDASLVFVYPGSDRPEPSR